MKPVNKHTVLKTVRETGQWNGFIAPSNVNSFHITGGWHLGINLTIVRGCAEHPDKYMAIGLDPDQCILLDEYLSNFSYYNCNTAELGKRIRFWEVV